MKKYKKKILFLIIVLLILVDQASKYVFYDLSFMNDNYFVSKVLNTGISWGIKILNFETLVFLIGFILMVLVYLRKKKEINDSAFTMIFAWGLGNYIDRLLYQWVRDFIDLQFFPVFNIADIFVSIGFLIIFIEISKQLLENQNKKISH